MISYSANKLSCLLSPSKQPVKVVEIQFPDESVYFTSGIGTPVPTGARVLHGYLAERGAISGDEQRVDPANGRASIGTYTINLVDKGKAISNLFAEKDTLGYGLRNKTVRLYWGDRQLVELNNGGMAAAWDDMAAPEAVQIIDKDVTYSKGVHTLHTADIQYSEKAQIFTPFKSQLRQSITATATMIPVYQDGYGRVAHGSSYRDAPNATVFYVLLKTGDNREVIRCTGSHTDPTLGLVLDVATNGRGALGTAAADHDVDTDAGQDQRPEVVEYIYLEMPAPKLIYALMTGEIYNQAATLPANYHRAIATTWVRTSDFVNIGKDLWDPLTDEGFIARIEGVEEVEAKEFIETELCKLIGAYRPVYGDGQIGLRRAGSIAADAPHVAVLNRGNILDTPSLNQRTDKVLNQVKLVWNYNNHKEEFTRTHLLDDIPSQIKFGKTAVAELTFRALHGSVHSYDAIRRQFNFYRERTSSPPLDMNVRCLPSLARLEAGDVVRVQHDNVRDYTNTTRALNRSFEIQQKARDWDTGQVSFLLSGALQPARPLPDLVSGGVLPDAEYNRLGTDITTLPNVSVAGGIAYINGAVTLSGGSDMSLPASTYYCLYPLVGTATGRITLNDNVHLKIKGVFTPESGFVIDGNSRGLATDGGMVGVAQSGGGITWRPNALHPIILDEVVSSPGTTLAARHQALPVINIRVESGQLKGLEGVDLRGGAGPEGGAVRQCDTFGTVVATHPGGAGGTGGAGLMITCKGIDPWIGGYIDLSGANGAAGATFTNIAPPNFAFLMNAGSGGGGRPGALVINLDGYGANAPDFSGSTLRCYRGATPINGTSVPGGFVYAANDEAQPIYSHYTHGQTHAADWVEPNLWTAQHRISYLIGERAAAVDVPEHVVAPPTGLALTSGTATLLPRLDGSTEARIKATWGNPSHPLFIGCRIEIRKEADTQWSFAIGLTDKAATEAYINGVTEGVAYRLRIKAFLQGGYSSAWVVSEAHPVVGKGEPPTAVASLSYVIMPDSVRLSWSEIADVDRAGYVLRRGADWASGADERVVASPATYIDIEAPAAGTHRWMIRSKDRSGNLATTEAVTQFVVQAPVIGGGAIAYEGADAVLGWAVTAGSFAVKTCRIYLGTVAPANRLAEIDARTYRTRVTWQGSQLLLVTGVDIVGNEGAPHEIASTIVSPAMPVLVAQVLDNNATVKWQDCKSTLPIDKYQVRVGATWATAVVKGDERGTFTVVGELANGQYKIHVAATDTAGNVTIGTVDVTLDNPPDYVLKKVWRSNFTTSTLTNARLESGQLIFPINTTIAFQDVYLSGGWANFQDKINAGYTYWLQPVPITARIEEVFDYAAVLPGVLITVTLTHTAVVAGGTITPTIYTRKLITDPWVATAPGAWSVYGIDFRYVMVRLDITSDGKAFYTGAEMEMRLDVKNITDQGSGTANATDPSGTWVPFNKVFIDIESIVPSVISDTEVKFALVFSDVPYPPGFYFRVWDGAGARITKPFTWQARGA